MSDIRDNVKLVLSEIVKIKPKQNLLIVTDSYARSRSIGNVVADVANSMGVQTVLTMMQPLANIGGEPPASVAAAMKTVDVVIEFGERSSAGHSTASKEAREAGVRIFRMHTDISEDYLASPISLEDVNQIRMRIQKLAKILTEADSARVITSYGTDITMSLKGRQARGGDRVHIFPPTSEVPISPVEGTTNGVVVADASVRGWGYLLRSPIRFVVRDGRAQIETVTSDIAEQVERFKKILTFDENANNCAAELGIGVSHNVSNVLRGDILLDYCMAGTVHIAVGRNNDIGGQTLSGIHNDVLMTGATVKADDTTVLDNGVLLI